MKKIECYVRESDVQPLVDALSQTGVSGISAYPVQGFGKQRAKGSGSLLPKMKMCYGAKISSTSDIMR
jgi:nitrogen regulatory protein PII